MSKNLALRHSYILIEGFSYTRATLPLDTSSLNLSGLCFLYNNAISFTESRTLTFRIKLEIQLEI